MYFDKMHSNFTRRWFLIFCLISSGLVYSSSAERSKRTLLSLLYKFFGFYPPSICDSRVCPPWKCQDDSAVIHGHCCHCPGWEGDIVPVPCSLDLKCPISSEPLCSDYNFMIECCCNGP